MSDRRKEIWRGKNVVIEINCDECFSVSKVGVIEKGPNAGQEHLRETRYYSTIENTLHATCDLVAKLECECLKSYLDEYRAMKDEIMACLKGDGRTGK